MQELQEHDPRRIGPYRLVGRLGAGGMGHVYAGRSPAGRLVAVKVIREEFAADPEFLVRFAREVAAARSVSGLFTAPVVDADTSGPEPWLATAYVAGPSLAQAVRDHGPLPVATATALAAGLAEGLAAIHAAGLVHRDLKPANVLLAEDGPRVIDFGISRAAEGTSLTGTGLVVGSPGYMSPEQATGAEVRPASDIFGLGAVVAFAASGQPPFGDGTVAALVYRVVHGQPALERVPEELRPLVERCLAKDPAQRPTTAELLADLDGTDLAGGWLPAPIVAEFTRHAVPALSGSGARDQPPSGAPAGEAAVGPPTATVSKPVPPSAPPGRRVSRRLVVLAACAAVLLVAGTVTALALHGGSGQPPSGPSTPAASGHPSLPPTSPPAQAKLAAPRHVTTTANSGYEVTVHWSDTSPGITGYNVDNGCPAGLCGGRDAELYKTTGPVTSTTFPVDPGSWTCFRVQARSAGGDSPWSSYGCAQTPGLTIPAAKEWTSTGLTLHPGDRIGITAAGTVYINPDYPASPAGTAGCTPAQSAPGAKFPIPTAPCWSLVARIGDGTPFEVGASRKFTAPAAGILYLGVNDDNDTGNTGSWKVDIEKGGNLPPAP